MKAQGKRLEILDTQKKLGDLFAHKARMAEGELKLGDALELRVNHNTRKAIRANHSATHLLHEALRQVLGDHVAQKGSLVAPDRLRFDISHNKPLSYEDIESVEKLANHMVLANTPVTTKLMGVDDAIASGARALFGEKYGDEVRVVGMGAIVNGKAWSVELCGGTHVSRTGDIGLVTILSDSAVSSGVRRIEALSGEEARHYLNAQNKQLRSVAGILKAAPQDLPERVSSIMEERKNLERENTELRKKLALGGDGQAQQEAQTVAGVSYLARVVQGVAANDLKSLVDAGKKQVGSGIVVFVGVNDDKAAIVVGVTNDLTSRFNAVDLVRAGAEVLGGKGGGGRPDMAQAGGPDGSQANAALEAIANALNTAA